MDEKLFRTLLYHSEGPELDFKAAQYAFKGAAEADKSKMLKDILAFGNAWRLGDAHILIGVRELDGGILEPCGIPPSDHIDDASLQQFVNSKTNRELKFSYRAFSYQGKSFGVITIPKQKRPLYLNARFGIVEANTVYFRRGSSCAIATPDDIARMGADDENDSQSSPFIRLELADPNRRQQLGASKLLKAIYHQEHKRHDHPDYTSSAKHYFEHLTSYANKNFWRELADWTWAQRAFASIGLAATNMGTQLARNVRIQAEQPKADGMRFVDASAFPVYPKQAHHIGPQNFLPLAKANEPVIAPKVLDHVDHLTIRVMFGDIQPQATAWTEKALFVTASVSGTYDLKFKIYADNISYPQDIELKLTFEVEQRQILELEDLKMVHREYLEGLTKQLEEQGF